MQVVVGSNPIARSTPLPVGFRAPPQHVGCSRVAVCGQFSMHLVTESPQKPHDMTPISRPEFGEPGEVLPGPAAPAEWRATIALPRCCIARKIESRVVGRQLLFGVNVAPGNPRAVILRQPDVGIARVVDIVGGARRVFHRSAQVQARGDRGVRVLSRLSVCDLLRRKDRSPKDHDSFTGAEPTRRESSSPMDVGIADCDARIDPGARPELPWSHLSGPHLVAGILECDSGGRSPDPFRAALRAGRRPFGLN